ncbi:MAG: tRNA pseudouridine(38-40) synthase TruA [Clostridiales bacterium]|nr:tRNA pseudouridine(38-40) synthase TruA [Clostridiales bacterium]
MKRIKLVVAYDGTNYHGWQLQPNGITVEEVLNRALTDLMKEPIAVIGASRTDSGVHARGQVAVAATENRMAPDKVCQALNQSLPEDIRVQSSEEVSLSWHPRRANCTKTYEYRILNCRIPMPLERLYAFHCHTPLDVERMRQGAQYLIGEHDFRSFCTLRMKDEDTVRTIYSLDICRENDVITIRVSGSGFLYHMVRIMAGTLIQVGKGACPPQRVEEILEARDRRLAGQTAMAKGLTLVSLQYEKELPAWRCGENRHWKYAMLQSHIREEKAAYLAIEHCQDEEWESLLVRNIHRSFQNGANRVYLADQEREDSHVPKHMEEAVSGRFCRSGGDSRLCPGARLGFYRIKEPDREQAAMDVERLTDEETRTLRICGNMPGTDVPALSAPRWYMAVDDNSWRMS